MKNYADYEVIQLTQQLVRHKSTNPGVYETEVGNFIYDWCSKLPGVEVFRDPYPADPKRFNVIAHLPGEIEHPNLVYISHMDVVPEGEGWNCDPYAAQIIDGKIYGRGACDMKSGMACAMMTLKSLAEMGKKPKHSFVFIASFDEEGNVMTGAEQSMTSGWVRADSWVADQEPTKKEIIVAHKGKIWFKIHAQGRAAHASTPWQGIDAIAAMGEVIHGFRERIERFPSHPELGDSTVAFGTIAGGINTNVVSDQVDLCIDVRLSPPTTPQDAIRILDEAIADAEAVVKGVKVTYDIIAQRPPIERDPDAKLYNAAIDAYRKVLGEEPVINFFSCYTDAAVIAGSLSNPNTMSFGPGDLGVCHKPNEFVDCEPILEVQQVLFQLAKDMIF
ncbi:MULTISPECIES: M20 family metallopeptidase [Anaerotruncus]|jgi:succinyl-diaminopimelate desuccinylase|uniref:M20 family metallopeptidase n=1 Tax=Anaerotruncus TaxID=244127 RepID=UPI00083047F4|nr:MULTISPECIES: M20 family metallopeptidase [Anaerotruncus]RGX56894.1 M20 family peptidase [Anaerotruncus sp. AF02-27]